VLNFDGSTVKHALQNTQNDCPSGSHSFRMHQIRFRPGLHPGPCQGSSPDPLAGLTGRVEVAKGNRGEERGAKGRRRGERRGGEGVRHP